ncbi:MAG TPA: alpha-glucan family phosphorylase [Candidatus Baltobacteraceae bacterium]|nr:alpha-glucan family phosphorylase [Candidatus Baltobacteraceae bacterium]
MRTLPDVLHSLTDLALDLRWLSCHDADELWETIDKPAWEATRNGWGVLCGASESRLRELGADPAFLRTLARLAQEREGYLERRTWFDVTHAGAIAGAIAYFSMEFGASEALPIYAGGLGVLAGDVLKASSDLGVPVVGVGLLYQRGYFRQAIDQGGEQRESYPYNDPASLPISGVLTEGGEQFSVALAFPGRTVHARVWKAQVGRVPLYLLDTNDPRNAARDRAITADLYGGDQETRLQQEIVLGIGGWRAIERLGIECAACHLNEGHAAFAVLERARAFAALTGCAFDEALRATRGGNLFTTHTAVAAGFDRFEPQLVSKYFREYAREARVTIGDLLALGREGAGANAPFNMAYLAVEGSAAVNAVSALHEQVSRTIFTDVAISHVTNGVHVPSWSAFACDEDGDLDSKIAAMSDAELWSARERLRAGLTQRFGFEANAMVACLSRRFTEYKRVTLLLSDPDRLALLLNDSKRPLRLLIAGKAHPRDTQGRAAIRRWVEFTQRPDVSGRALFVPDYDLGIASAFTQGADLWLNTPRRPWEACGTSGMKALMNGGLNLSTLDGWWDEAYAPQFGWALGDRDPDAADDEADAQRLYEILERDVVPAFFDRDERGIPTAWVAKIRAGLSQLAPRFSASRMVRDYVEQYYVTAARRQSPLDPDKSRSMPNCTAAS